MNSEEIIKNDYQTIMVNSDQQEVFAKMIPIQVLLRELKSNKIKNEI